MKDRFTFDLRQIMDEIFEASENFQQAVKNGFKHNPPPFWGDWDDRVDFYPAHPYPPANVYMDNDKTMTFEFALAGFAEEDIDLQFVGDHMVLNAKAPEKPEQTEDLKYFKKRLKMKNIENQKYYVPEDKFDRENVKAVYKSGLLTVTIPAKEVAETKDGIKIEIVKEAE